MVDVRGCQPSKFAQIRRVREEGIVSLKKSINTSGLIAGTLITVMANSDSPYVVLDDEMKKEEEKYKVVMGENYAKDIRHGKWVVVDGMHRVRALQQLWDEKKLGHPYVSAQVLQPKTSDQICMVLAYAENMKLTHVVTMTVADHLSRIFKSIECMREYKLPNPDKESAVAAFVDYELSKPTSSTRAYVAMALKLSPDAREMIELDSKSSDPKFTFNVLYKNLKLYSLSHPVQVAVLNYIKRWHQKKDKEWEEEVKKKEEEHQAKIRAKEQSQSRRGRKKPDPVEKEKTAETEASIQ
jgi:hypothetical protein